MMRALFSWFDLVDGLGAWMTSCSSSSSSSLEMVVMGFERDDLAGVVVIEGARLWRDALDPVMMLSVDRS
jgi:hypothetical protein